MFNVGSIFFGRGQNPSGGGGGITNVYGIDGIYVDDTFPLTPYVELGGALGTSQAITAQLSSNREIVMPNNVLFFSLDGAIVSGATRVAEIIPSDPFSVPNLGGFQVTENITTFGASQRKGFSLLTTDGDKTTAWIRRAANDGTYFGTTYGNPLAPGQAGFTFFDSGESATGQNNISLGLFDTDTDDGFSFQVKGNMSLYFVTPVTPPTNANSAGLAWDSATSQVQGALLNNGISVDCSSGEIAFVLGNDVGDPLTPAQFLSTRQILTNGFSLEMTDLAGTFFDYGNSAVIGNNAAGYVTDYTAQSLTFNDPTGVYESIMDPVNVGLYDNSGNETVLSSTTILLENILSPSAYTNIQNQTIRMQDGSEFVSVVTPAEFDAEDTITNDFAHLNAAEVLLSNGVAGGGSSMSKSYLAVNAPLGGGTFGVADFWGGGFTTDDPGSPGSQGPVVKMGQLTGGAVVLDTTRYINVNWGGVALKLLVGV